MLQAANGTALCDRGLDLSATLAQGRIVLEQGLLREPSALIRTMAEPTPPQLAARLALTLERGRGHCLLAVDEGAEPDETAPQGMSERIALFVDLSDVGIGDSTGFPPEAEAVQQARAALQGVTIPAEVPQQITPTCLQFGIDSLRAAQFTLRAARAHTALSDLVSVTSADAEVACVLTFAHRVTQLPQTEPPPPR